MQVYGGSDQKLPAHSYWKVLTLCSLHFRQTIRGLVKKGSRTFYLFVFMSVPSQQVGFLRRVWCYNKFGLEDILISIKSNWII